MSHKILIIDDNELYRICVVKSLEHEGYQNIVTAHTGKDGIEKAKTEKPELVILDVVLPDANGLEVCHEIKSLKGLEQVKVVVITGYIDAADIGKALTAGADHFVSKAVDLSSLLKLVKKLLKG